jgi:hypothetical protein
MKIRKTLGALLAAGMLGVCIGAQAGTVRCLLDVDGDGQVDALTDGLLLMRAASGYRGAALVIDALAEGATRTDPDDIMAFITANAYAYDVDGDGVFMPHTDGKMIIRHMFGLSGEDVVRDATAASAPRRNWQGVREHLEKGC